MTGIRIRVKPDTLDEKNRQFGQRPLSQSVFLNSVPKSGSHLLRNVMRMFVPVEQQYQAEFIQNQLLNQHLDAFLGEQKYLSWGHLMFTDKSAVAVGRLRHILLVRDPYDWCSPRRVFF